MAAASDLVDRAVRTKQVVERARGKAQGAFGHENKTVRRQRDREAGKLDEWERAELLYLWSGNASATVQSTQGAIVDRLLRAPPRVGEELDREVVAFLLRRGAQGAPREKLVEVLAAENVGATRHEARLTLRRMVGAGRVEFFVADVVRRKQCTCRSAMGEVEGTARQRGACVCGSGVEESVPTEMVRIVPGKHSRGVPGAYRPEERWAKADADLEAYCQTMTVSETAHCGGGRLHAPCRGGAGAARGAMARMPIEHARVIERAYGSFATPQWAGLSPEAARLAPLCASVERARREYVDAQVTVLGHWGDPGATRAVDRATYVPDVLRRKLDLAPEDELGKVRWSREREKFVEAVERDAAKLLLDAVASYREMRGNR